MEQIRVRASITGRVQGVWYRGSTQERASSLGLSGWVRNRPDGSVELEAQGSEAAVQALLEWCHQGPPAARVRAVDSERIETIADGVGFEILR